MAYENDRPAPSQLPDGKTPTYGSSSKVENVAKGCVFSTEGVIARRWVTKSASGDHHCGNGSHIYQPLGSITHVSAQSTRILVREIRAAAANYY